MKHFGGFVQAMKVWEPLEYRELHAFWSLAPSPSGRVASTKSYY
jgi:hypothetical protein